MKDDLYQGFAERYDLSFGSFGEYDSHVADFFRQLFEANDVRTVLDCACGTGRHLPLFHSLGCEICGTDVSEAMLAQSQKNLAHYGLDIPLHQVDFRNLPQHFQQKFDAVMCMASIGFMPDEENFLQAFKSMAGVLREGGVLVLTTIPTDGQWRAKPRFMLIANRPEFSRLFVIEYLENSARYDILDIFHDGERNDFEVWSAELHVLLRAGQERLLKAAGFHHLDFFGDFNFSPYDEEQSNNLITVARKK